MKVGFRGTSDTGEGDYFAIYCKNTRFPFNSSFGR
jgi:hypothetical protein